MCESNSSFIRSAEAVVESGRSRDFVKWLVSLLGPDRYGGILAKQNVTTTNIMDF